MKRKKTASTFLSMMLCLAVMTGCNNRGGFDSENLGGFATMEKSADYSAPAMEEATSEDAFYETEETADQASGANEQMTTTETKIIRTGDMQIEVADYAKARVKLTEILAPYKVQIMNEAEEKLTYRIQNQLQLKVAPEQLDSVVAAIGSMALHLDRKSISARDVTKQYVDLETRLASKRAVVTRYREILKSARTVEEILSVEDNLRKVVEEIESVEGQLRYLKDQVQLSTLNVLMYESYEQPEVRRHSFWSRIGKALTGGWSVFQELIIGLISIWPILILLVVLGWWWMRRWRRRRDGGKT